MISTSTRWKVSIEVRRMRGEMTCFRVHTGGFCFSAGEPDFGRHGQFIGTERQEGLGIRAREGLQIVSSPVLVLYNLRA